MFLLNGTRNLLSEQMSPKLKFTAPSLLLQGSMPQ
jgi:hypothetical protein